MRPVRDTSTGLQGIQCNSYFTNKRNDWRKKMGMSQWHKKAPKHSKKKANNSSGLKAEETKKDKKVKDEDKDKNKEEEKPYSMPESIPTQSMDIDDTDLSLANRLLSATPEPSSAMTASNGLLQDWVRQSHPSFPQTGCYDSAGAWDVSSGYYCGGQSDYVEQSREATWANASIFPAANMPAPTTYMNASRYPSEVPQKYIHPGQGPMSAEAYSYGQPTTGHGEQSREATWANASTFPEANLPVLNTNPTATGSINTPWYPSRLLHQNIYAPGPSSVMTASNGMAQYQTGQAYPPLPQTRLYGLAGETRMLTGSYSYGQATTGYVEQTSTGNLANTPTFPSTNQYAQATNNVGPGSLNTSGCPLVSARQNLYSAAVHPLNQTPPSMPPIPSNNDNGSFAIRQHSNHVPAPTHPVPRPTLGGYNRPDPSRRYGVDDFWDQEMGRQELPPINVPAEIQATPQSAGPRRVRSRPVALPPPVRPAESSNSALSSPARDPFMGAEYSPVLPEDQMNADGPWGLDDWL